MGLLGLINNSEEFNKIRDQFWKNSDKLDQLDPQSPEYDKLLEENNKLINKLN